MNTPFLTPQQKAALESVPPTLMRLHRRSRVVLLYDAGWSTTEVAAEAGLSPRRARFWRRRFVLQGMDIFPGITLDLPVPTSTVAPSSIPFPEPLPVPGILPDDTLAEAGRKTWLFHFAEMLHHESGTRQGDDIEALHDMRVATRRMRAAFDIFAQAFEPQAIRPYLKGLRATGRALGQVRDLDVFMEKAARYQTGLPLEQQPGLSPLIAGWEQERSAARLAMLAHLDSKKYQRFKERFNSFLHSPVEGELPENIENPTPSRVRDVVPMLIYTRLAAVRAYEAILATATIPQLHALRIEFKKFRYTVEYFKEVLGKPTKDVIDVIKSLQDHLGELHDADVACGIIRQFLDQWETQQANLPLTQRQSSEAVVSYLANQHAERYRRMVTFPAAWERFKQPEFQQNLAMAIAGL